jgi:hypothetical protein
MALQRVGSAFELFSKRGYLDGNNRTFVGEVLSNTALADGRFLLTWKADLDVLNVPLSYHSDIVARIYNADGTVSSGGFTLHAPSNGWESKPVIAQLANGNIIATWTSWNEAQRSTYQIAAIFDSNGSRIKADFQLYSRATFVGDVTDIEALANGGFIATMQGRTYGQSGVAVKYQMFDANGVAISALLDAPEIADVKQYGGSIEQLSDGRIVIAWNDRSMLDGDTSGYAVKARIYTANGTAAGADFIVNTTFQGDQLGVKVLALSNGGFAVTFVERAIGSNDGSALLKFRVYDNNGNAITAEKTISQTKNGSLTLALKDGRFIAVYGDDPDGDQNADIYATVYNADGSVSVSEFIVNTGRDVLGSGEIPRSVVQLANGNVLITWSDGSSERAQIFSLASTGGTAGNDVFSGTATADVYDGKGGDDWLYGNAGNDTLSGGDGNDNLTGGPGADALDGGAGFDYARYDYATSAVSAALYNPAVNNGEAAGDSYTSIEGLTGSAYADYLYGNAASNYIFGNAGNDWIDGMGGTDYLYGGAGNDNLVSRAGAQSFDGGAGFDFVRYDYAKWGVSAALYNPLVNNGEAAGDTYVSIEGLTGSAYGDYLYGNAVANYIYGYGGNDWLDGQAGKDYLFGGVGNDTIKGGLGKDVLDGGAGADRFFYSSTSEGGDSIVAFDTADVFAFKASAFGGLALGALAARRFWSNTTGRAHDADDRFIYNTTDDTLWYDSNGNAAGGTIVKIADLTNDFALTASDIVIV